MSFVRLEELYSDKLRDQNKNFKTISDYQSTGKQLQLQKQESSETKRRIEFHRNCVPDLPPQIHNHKHSFKRNSRRNLSFQVKRVESSKNRSNSRNQPSAERSDYLQSINTRQPHFNYGDDHSSRSRLRKNLVKSELEVEARASSEKQRELWIHSMMNDSYQSGGGPLGTNSVT